MRRKKKIVLEKLEVADYAAEGRSLARADGKVVFIEGVVPGDVVDVLLTKNKKDWAEGRPILFHSYSPIREAAFCRHFGLCGGCKWQMLPYDMQLAFKQREVEENLRRLGKISLPPISPIAGAAETRFYRNKLEFTFSNKRYRTHEEMKLLSPDETPEAENALGFHVPRIFDKIIPIGECWLQAEPSNTIRNTVAAFAEQQGYSYYDIRRHSGWLRNLVIRTATTGEVMVNLVLGHDDEPERRRLCDHLLATVPGITTLLYTINPKWNDSLHDLEPVVYAGPGYIIEQLEDLRFRISPQSFFQTNSRQAEKLYGIAREFAELKGTETLYDLYCGTGSIGLFMHRGAQKIIGVEMVERAVQDARANAELNGITHASFHAGDVVDICTSDFFALHGRPDTVITDPPRAGMHDKLVKKLLEMAAPLVVYVSCNSATQARDLQALDEGYTVEKVQPVDMFPHTHHIENVVQLRRR